MKLKEQPTQASAEDKSKLIAICKENKGLFAEVEESRGGLKRLVCPIISYPDPHDMPSKDALNTICPLARYQFTPVNSDKSVVYRPSCASGKETF